MATSKKVLREEIKSKWMEKIKTFLVSNEEECLIYASNKIAVPVVDSEGGEDWLTITLSVPLGSRDGEAFDGYEMAQDYDMKLKEKVEKKEKAEKDKAKKIARDEKLREEKKKLKEANKKKEGE